MKLTKEELRVRIDKILSDAPVIWYVLDWAERRFAWMDTQMVESGEVLDWTTIPTTSIVLSASELAFDDAGEQMLTATVAPSDTTDIVLWTTSNNTVARVVDGKVVAVGAGTATVTATSGDQSASCTVTVAGTNEVSLLYALPEETQFTTSLVPVTRSCIGRSGRRARSWQS